MTSKGTPQPPLLNERYQLLDVIGEGGMAVVWRAEDSLLGRQVAVKILRDQYAADPEFLARFRREARAAAALNDPGVVGVYDVGQDALRHFLVMEYVAGQDLKSVIRNEAPLPVERVVHIGTALGRAVAAAHSVGLVHRDIKPQNVLMTPDGRTKVADFGIARAVAASELTAPGLVLGTVHYVSPEQAAGGQATPASDVYSVGVVLYEMLTSRLPFDADSTLGVAMKIMHNDPSPVEQANPLVPAGLAAIVRRAMARRPEDRYPEAGALAEALSGFWRATEQVTGGFQRLPAGPAARSGAAVPASPVAQSGANVRPVPVPATKPPAGGQVSSGRPPLPGRQAATPASTTPGIPPSISPESPPPTTPAAAPSTSSSTPPSTLPAMPRSSSPTMTPSTTTAPARPSPPAPAPSSTPTSQPAIRANAAPKVRAASHVPPGPGRPSPAARAASSGGDGPLLDRTGLLLAFIAAAALAGLIPLWFQVWTRVDPAALPFVRAQPVGPETAIGNGSGTGAPAAGTPGAMPFLSGAPGQAAGAGGQAAVPEVAVPEVRNLDEIRAAAQLRALGLGVSTEHTVIPGVAAGKVISQSIGAGESAAPGEVVALVVTGQEIQRVPVPNVVGGSYQAAAEALQKAGLVPQYREEWTGANSPTQKTVTGLSPPPGNLAIVGEPVAVTVDSGGWKSLGVTFGDGIHLSGVFLAKNTYAPGETVTVAPSWEAAADVEANYVAYAVLTSAAGDTVSQDHKNPPVSGHPTADWVQGDTFEGDAFNLGLGSAPAGHYKLWLYLEREDAPGAPLSVRGRGSATVQGERVLVMEVEVGQNG